jgi:hypothetical protein
MDDIIKLLVPLAKNAYEAVMAAIARGRASGELTEEQAQAYRNNVNAAFDKDYAQTDAQRGRGTQSNPP